MAQGSWLVLSTSTATAQIIYLFLVTFMIGIGGLTHAIASSSELFLGMFSSSKISILEYLKFIGVAVLGNSLGGAFFVGFLNYTHIKKTQLK